MEHSSGVEALANRGEFQTPRSLGMPPARKPGSASTEVQGGLRLKGPYLHPWLSCYLPINNARLIDSLNYKWRIVGTSTRKLGWGFSRPG